MRYFVLFIFLSSCTTYELITPPEMYLNGDRVIIEAQDVPNARAVKWGDKYYILYNPDYMSKHPEEVQKFIYWHEYYHHALNHSELDYSFRDMDEKQKDADCFALIRIDTPEVRKYLKKIRRVDDLNAYCRGQK